ncbi:MAG: preprotein translocase subunit SecA, partial [Clostridia bacterium]|nr:preprotein translocase subunit SecA [Clostridia bacterium]
MKLERLLFGDYSKRAIKKIEPVAQSVEALSDKYKAMTDEELGGVTALFRERYEAGETLEQLLPDAFAAVREAADRVLHKRPFHVQILGGILLHQGRIAEMKTGEGKTLVATMPAYLNALTGKGVHIVTVNEYLAQRDSDEMGRIFGFLGMSTGVVLSSMSARDKKAMYDCDITYGTNTEFGFDYLRDNIAKSRSQLMQRGFNFCIIDEIDSILIDEARTPLIISGISDKTSDIYSKCNDCTRRLTPKVIKEMDTKQETDDENYDYIVDEKHNTAVLTPRGIKKVESFFAVENLNDPENAEISHNMNQAIHAHGCKKKDVDYVIVDGEVVIVDKFTGRLMPGRRYNDGLHQAIEAKEKVNIKGENKTIATVTIQNYFRMYSKLSGMTGTAMTEEDEFREIYGLDVVEVPTNKPMIRRDNHDRIYVDEKSKFEAIVAKVKECRDSGRPVLIGTGSVEKSEQLGKMMKAAGIKFNMLNAKDHAREAQVIAEAGMSGSVTLATNMAGRGTDIMLGGNPEMLARDAMRRMDKFTPEQIALSVCEYRTEDPVQLEANRVYKELHDKYEESIRADKEKVIAAGGLFIIGSERHESRRIDNQLRGRSGRQGDPGESTFYVSLTDDIMRLFGDSRMKKFAAISQTLSEDGGDGDLTAYLKILSDVIEKAQKSVESDNFKRRKNVLQYDDILNEQRLQIYGQRNEILLEGDISDKIRDMVASTVDDSVASAIIESENGKERIIDIDALTRKYNGWGVSEGELEFARNAGEKRADEVADIIRSHLLELFDKRIENDADGMFRAVERYILLDVLDELWLDHIDEMEDLEQNVMLQSYAQRDPLNEYRILGSQMYADMIDEVRQKTVLKVLTCRIEPKAAPSSSGFKNLRSGRTAGAAPARPSAAPAASSAPVAPVRRTQ